MSPMLPGDDPRILRERADRFRNVMRGVYDTRVLAEIERFVAELEAMADEMVRSETRS
jgi:hypothetical protein